MTSESERRGRIALETAFPEIGVALEVDGQVLLPETDLRRQRASALHPAVEELLRRARLTPRDVSEILVDRGPGSYTGLRVGLALARTLGELLGVRLRCSYSTDQLAWLGRDKVARDEEFLVCLDARKGQWFAARYVYGAAGKLERLEPPSCHSPDSLRRVSHGAGRVLTARDDPPLDMQGEKLGFPRAEGLFEIEELAEEVRDPGPLYLMPPV